MNGYWDPKVEIPGYEAAPTKGHGHDKYYDDNAWLAIAFLEAYETTGEPRYLTRADKTLQFVLSGWDDQGGAESGGIKRTRQAPKTPARTGRPPWPACDWRSIATGRPARRSSAERSRSWLG